MNKKKKSKSSAVVWCFLVGIIGGHWFYLGKGSRGLLYFLFSWTFIPVFLALVDFIKLTSMSDQEFDSKYNLATIGEKAETEQQTATTKKASKKKVVFTALGIPVALFVLAGIFSSPTSDNTSRATSSQPVLKKWNISEKKDEMSGAMKADANLWSDNEVNFSFPYGGKQKARLELRKKNGKYTAALFAIRKGQLMCSMGCKVKIKFGDKAPVTYRMSGTSDGSTETIFSSLTVGSLLI